MRKGSLVTAIVPEGYLDQSRQKTGPWMTITTATTIKGHKAVVSVICFLLRSVLLDHQRKNLVVVVLVLAEKEVVENNSLETNQVGTVLVVYIHFCVRLYCINYGASSCHV